MDYRTLSLPIHESAAMANSPTVVSLMWDNEDQTILRFDFGPRWTWAEARRARLRANDMIDAAPHHNNVGALIVPPSSYIPPNIFSGAASELLSRHPRIVVLALVTNSTFIRTLFVDLVRLVPSLRSVYYCYPTLESARAFLQAELTKRAKTLTNA